MILYFLNDKKGIITTYLNVGVEMPVVQLVDTIKQRKEELGLTINALSLESGVGTRTINRILAGKDVRYSSISLVLESLDLTISISENN